MAIRVVAADADVASAANDSNPLVFAVSYHQQHIVKLLLEKVKFSQQVIQLAFETVCDEVDDVELSISLNGILFPSKLD